MFDGQSFLGENHAGFIECMESLAHEWKDAEYRAEAAEAERDALRAQVDGWRPVTESPEDTDAQYYIRTLATWSMGVFWTWDERQYSLEDTAGWQIAALATNEGLT